MPNYFFPVYKTNYCESCFPFQHWSVLELLADRIDLQLIHSRPMIGYWHHVVCLSVCIVELMVGVGVKSCTIVFLGRYFLFTS